jgi:flavin-dependent dehydrogenase
MHFGVARMGYGWIFPHRGSYGVGVMGRASEFEDPLKVFSAFAASAGLAAPRPRGHTIPWGGFPRPLIGPRMLLAGDAAGLADPFHGEGIHSALLSGNLAGQAVVEGIGGKKDTLPWYAKECDRLIVQEKRVALRMAQMLDRYPKLFLKLFFDNTETLDRYLDIPAGRSDYVQFQRWLLKRLPRTLFTMLFRGAGRT